MLLLPSTKIVFFLTLYLQTEVFKIIHSMLVSSESRDSCLTFIATALQRNHRKAQLQVSGNTNPVPTKLI